MKHGLSEKCDPEALGVLMDTMELYMREMLTKVILKARVRQQDAFQNLKKDQVGSITNLKTVIYSLEDKKGF